MSARAIWKGSLKFSLVTFPVKAYKATDDPGDDTKMNELHAECNHQAGRKNFCAHCNKDILATEIIKGVPNGDGTFVILTKEELATIAPESSDVIAIDSFAPVKDVDFVYVRETHYITADGKVGQEAYALLHAALVNKRLVGQGRWTVYGREHNVIVRAFNGGLAVHQMRTVSEVRAQDQLPGYQSPGSVTIKPAALKLVGDVVETMLGEFDATEYVDEYAQEFKALVESKVSGVAIVGKTPKAALPASDLMAALQASLTHKPPKSRTVKATAKPAAKAPAKKSKAG